MYGIYYNLPINFKKITSKMDADKTNLENSIAREINLVLTSAYGECKFNELYGCAVWEMDFDILCTHNVLKEKITQAINTSIQSNINRLALTRLKVNVLEQTVTPVADASLRTKKRVEIFIDGKTKKTNRDFSFFGYFFLGPLSYS